MTDTTKTEPIIQLSEALGRVISNSRTEKAAAYAYLQASLSQCAIQALIDLLQNQNVISREQIQRALDHAYTERFKQLSGSNGVVAGVAPSTRSP